MQKIVQLQRQCKRKMTPLQASAASCSLTASPGSQSRNTGCCSNSKDHYCHCHCHYSLIISHSYEHRLSSWTVDSGQRPLLQMIYLSLLHSLLNMLVFQKQYTYFFQFIRISLFNRYFGNLGSSFRIPEKCRVLCKAVYAMQPAARCHHVDGIALLAAAENLPGV